jgi:hypothetical protein
MAKTTVDFDLLTEEETKALAAEALANLTDEDLIEVVDKAVVGANRVNLKARWEV